MGARGRRRFMTGQRVKRFPLELADLVREPRRRDERPGDARDLREPRAEPSGAAKPAATSSSEARARVAAKPALSHAATLNAKPALSRAVAPKAAKPAGAGAIASKLAKPAALSSTFGKPAGGAPSRGAPGIALNGSLALTSERVRERMVERVRASGIADARVLQALAAVPRHMFVDPGLATQAYEEAALPIGHHQTISKPTVVARMLELALAGRELPRVLEIGTGCGYQAAVLSKIASDVYSIERIKPLYERAKTNLRPLRIPNIRLHYGDGRLGLPSAAPFDAIVIAAAGFEVPQALLEQLAIGGRLIAPVATAQDPAGEATQVLTLVERTGPSQWRESRLDRVFFVPLKSGVI